MSEPSMRTFATETGVIAYELLEANTPLASPTVTPTIVLLHNFMSTGRAAWGALLDALTEHFRVLLPDLPGHGQSVGHPIGFHHRHICLLYTSRFVDHCRADSPTYASPSG